VTTATLSLATGLFTHRAERWLPHILEAIDFADLTTPERLAMFLGQVGHESAGFRKVEENMNYSVVGLMATWPSRFPTRASAEPLARQPEKIANRVYANRMGNGPEASGDGWRFRGRGLIQLTGRDNYRACGRALGVDLEAAPELLVTDRLAALSAAWFWRVNKLSDLCPDVRAVTRRINGGLHGLTDRERRYERALRVLSGPSLDFAPADRPNPPLEVSGGVRPVPRRPVG
jgi:putative chitinase